jgi:hypothetical protein
MYTQQLNASLGSGTWEQHFCPTWFCEQSSLFVQRCDEYPDTWRVARNPGEGGWLVAAVEPLCPFCGETLVTSAHVVNGVEELKGGAFGAARVSR